MPVVKIIKKNPVLLLCIFILNHCAINTYTTGPMARPLVSQPLSLYHADLRTCVFDPQYSIVHFPMLHIPPKKGQYDSQTYTAVVLSQFQLLHTILDYHRSNQWQLALFDEGVTSDNFNSESLQIISIGAGSASYTLLTGETFNWTERIQTAKLLFARSIPRYYEQLSTAQKNFLFYTGASLTLYFLSKIPKVHKVISERHYLLARQNIKNPDGSLKIKNNDYWVYTFREQELKKEVLFFRQRNYNPRQLIMIAYGSAHDFSDDFSGYPFQSGHKKCLAWQNNNSLIPKILP